MASATTTLGAMTIQTGLMEQANNLNAMNAAAITAMLRQNLAAQDANLQATTALLDDVIKERRENAVAAQQQMKRLQDSNVVAAHTGRPACPVSAISARWAPSRRQTTRSKAPTAKNPSAPIACVLLAPWALTLLARQHPGVPVAVLGETTLRVVFATQQALEAGVQVGMRETAARELAAALRASVGLGTSREVAQLAALRARAGEVHEVTSEMEKAFLRLSRVDHLRVLGLTPAHVERLHFLSLSTLADL